MQLLPRRLTPQLALLALGWLPTGILVSALLRQHPLGEWLHLWPAAPAGLPLAGAIWQLYGLGYPRAAWWMMALLGFATIPTVLGAGLLGPVAMVVAAGVVSLPAWLMIFLVGRRSQRQRCEAPGDHPPPNHRQG